MRVKRCKVMFILLLLPFSTNKSLCVFDTATPKCYFFTWKLVRRPGSDRTRKGREFQLPISNNCDVCAQFQPRNSSFSVFTIRCQKFAWGSGQRVHWNRVTITLCLCQFRYRDRPTRLPLTAAVTCCRRRRRHTVLKFKTSCYVAWTSKQISSITKEIVAYHKHFKQVTNRRRRQAKQKQAPKSNLLYLSLF